MGYSADSDPTKLESSCKMFEQQNCRTTRLLRKIKLQPATHMTNCPPKVNGMAIGHTRRYYGRLRIFSTKFFNSWNKLWIV